MNKKLLLMLSIAFVGLVVSVSVPLWGAGEAGIVWDQWPKAEKWIKTGVFTLTNKTLSGPTFSDSLAFSSTIAGKDTFAVNAAYDTVLCAGALPTDKVIATLSGNADSVQTLTAKAGADTLFFALNKTGTTGAVSFQWMTFK